MVYSLFMYKVPFEAQSDIILASAGSLIESYQSYSVISPMFRGPTERVVTVEENNHELQNDEYEVSVGSWIQCNT